MTDLVVDASLLVTVLTGGSANELLLRRLSEPRRLHAPGHIDFEFINAVRGMVRGQKINEALAKEAIADLANMRIHRHWGTLLGRRIWELRENFNAYDAAYIALAEIYDCPLLTGDKKLLGSHHARVEVQFN